MTGDLPQWPDPGSEEGLAFFQNAVAIFRAWRRRGYSNPAAIAMLTMAEAESSLDPKALGDKVKGKPTAFGLYQWHGERIAAIRQGCGVDIAALPPIADQIAAAAWELDHIHYLGKAAIEACGTAAGAAAQATALFERAGAADAARRRGAMAERWTVYLAKQRA